MIFFYVGIGFAMMATVLSIFETSTTVLVKEIQDSIPDINYIINPKWDQTHVVGSLRYALDYWKGEDILIFYADTLFKPNILKDFIGGCTENMIASSSLKIGNKNISRQTNSEKIVVLDNYLRKSIDSKKLARKHFTGLTFIKKATVKKFKSFLNKEYNVTDNYRLSEALIEFVNNQTDIKFKDFDIDDSWVELDSLNSVTKFIFVTSVTVKYLSFSTGELITPSTVSPVLKENFLIISGEI